ncbi:MAG: replication-associated recombination protein A [Acidimicrobiales bacterium]|nr:replication-associated recombination protein A [Acidimicrobiales bacterium]
MADDLFAAAAEDRLAAKAPLAERLRPRSLDHVVGQDHLLGPGQPLRVLIEGDRLSSVILWGPPGTGKTTLARVIAGHTAKAFETLSAVTAGVKDVREVVARAEHRLGERGQGTILFLDEVHRFNKAQQDALLPSVESGLLVLIGATTENPYFEVNPPLLSRSTLFRLNALDDVAARRLIERALKAEGATADDDAVTHLAERANGDGRHTLTSLEVAVALARARSEPPVVTATDAEAALGTKAIRYGRDEHYDVISAFIKSIRGSDADAGLYWLATMLEAGEDARFIARRLIILASEDVGEADPTGLVVAVAAAHAVEHVGLPEAQLNLAQAVVHLASAPKSNRSALGIWRAREDVRSRPSSGVPAHLRDSHYQGAAKLGHGDGYRYPHDDDRGWLPQQYLPDDVVGARYYQPSDHGHEREIAERMAEHRTTPAGRGDQGERGERGGGRAGESGGRGEGMRGEDGSSARSGEQDQDQREDDER